MSMDTGRNFSLGQKLLENFRNLISLLGAEIPVNGPVQAVYEFDLRFPAEELARPGIVRDAVHRAGRHFRMELDARRVA